MPQFNQLDMQLASVQVASYSSCVEYVLNLYLVWCMGSTLNSVFTLIALIHDGVNVVLLYNALWACNMPIMHCSFVEKSKLFLNFLKFSHCSLKIFDFVIISPS